MESLSIQSGDSTVTTGRRNDRLSKALPKPEHPGRVHGVEGRISQTAYFGHYNAPEKSVEALKAEVALLRAELLGQKAQEENACSSPQLDIRSDMGSCQQPPLPEGKDPFPCNFAVWNNDGSKRIVAKGLVYNDKRKEFHHRPIPHDTLVVHLETHVTGEEDTQLPYRIEDEGIETIYPALTYLVLWPVDLIVVTSFTPHRPKTKLSQVSCPLAKKARTEEQTDDNSTPAEQFCPFHGINLDSLPTDLRDLARKSMVFCANGNQVKFELPKELFCMSRQTTEFLGLDQIKDFLKQDWVSSSHMNVFMRMMYEVIIVQNNLSNQFGFIAPHMISNGLNSKVDDQAQYLHDAWMTQVINHDFLFFVPWNTGGHWLLLVINPNKEIVYFFDSLYRRPSEQQQLNRVLRVALRMYRATRGIKRPNHVGFDMKRIMRPVQTNGSDCGYFVMRYMWEIIGKEQPTIPNEYFSDLQRDTYSQEQLDEIRCNFAQFVHDYCSIY